MRNNRRIKFYEPEDTTGSFYGSIESRRHDHLHMSKINARWVPKMLTAEMKAR